MALRDEGNTGVDAAAGLVHTVVGTAGNVNNVTQAGALLHGGETAAFGDSGDRGADRRDEARGRQWHVAMQPGKRRATGFQVQMGAARPRMKSPSLPAVGETGLLTPFRSLPSTTLRLVKLAYQMPR